MVFFVNFEHISHLFPSVSTVNFEHVIADWEMTQPLNPSKFQHVMLCILYLKSTHRNSLQKN